MCSGIEFAGRPVRWKDPDRQLPVLRRDGSIDWIRWGEDYGIESHFTNGACARHERLAGKWRRCFPIPVKIPAASFMERDKRREEVWIEVPAGSFIQGLVARGQMTCATRTSTRSRISAKSPTRSSRNR